MWAVQRFGFIHFRVILKLMKHLSESSFEVRQLG